MSDHSALIVLGRSGRTAIVDADLLDAMARFNWSFDATTGYAYRIERNGMGRKAKQKKVYMHRAVCGFLGKTDHRNRNKLDNRRDNLRPSNSFLNALNVDPSIRNTSGTVGVDYMRSLGRWRARIRVAGRDIHLGLFDTSEAAAEARICAFDAYAKPLFQQGV
jgi:hypothetical protein